MKLTLVVGLWLRVKSSMVVMICLLFSRYFSDFDKIVVHHLCWVPNVNENVCHLLWAVNPETKIQKCYLWSGWPPNSLADDKVHQNLHFIQNQKSTLWTPSPHAINAFSVPATPFCQKSQVYYLQQRPSGDLGARGSGRTNNYRHLVLSI